jgi:hypothetical protein
MKTIIHKNKVFQEVETDFYSSWKETIVPEKAPRLSWKKAKITLDQWNDIKNICEYTNNKHSSECLIRLYFNCQKDEWAMLMHPQEMNGMTVDDDLDTDLILSLGEGWAEAGSVHHHCSSGAFQSSTDESDEMQASGLHITIGKIGSDEYEIDARFREGESFTTPNLSTFFEVPNWLVNDVPDKFQYEIFEYLLCSKGNSDLAKGDWIAQCKEKPKLNTVHSYSQRARYSAYGKSSYQVTPYTNHTIHKIPDADQKELSLNDATELDDYEHAQMIKDAWNEQEKKMFNVIEDVALQYDLGTCDVLSIIDDPLKEMDGILVKAWQDIRMLVKDTPMNLTEIRKFISNDQDDVELVLTVAHEYSPYNYGTTYPIV